MVAVMKLAVYSKDNLKGNPTKVSLTNDLKSLGHRVVEVDCLLKVDAFDCLLVFGGDGTMLHASTEVDCPIIGINLGNVGFLTQFESSVTAKQLVEAISNGRYEFRPLLETTCGGLNQFALNDFVVKTTSNRPIFFSMKVDGQFVDKYHADGVIISTPTGSTAYSLSAGGPIVSPGVNAIIINPICPHSLHSRPLIVSGDSKIEVLIEGGSGILVADGDRQVDVDNSTTIEITKSAKQARFVCGNDNFYKKLLEKMNKWGVAK